MANEADWSVVSASFSTPDGRSVDNSPETPLGDDVGGVYLGDSNFMVSRAVQLGSEYLYIMKEHLVKAGWTVVSCSYLKEYSDGTTKNFVSPRTFINQDGNNSGPFHATNQDCWLPIFGYQRQNDAGYAGPLTASWDQTDNPAWSVIYPGWVKEYELTTDIHRGLESAKFNIVDPGPPPNTMTDQQMGRSWILLKAPKNFQEPNQITLSEDRNYHILIDYVHGGASKPYFINGTSYTYDMFRANLSEKDYSNDFGAYVNILIFPNYGDEHSNKDELGVSYDPSPTKRPSHKYEIGPTVRTTINEYGSRFFKFVKANKSDETQNDTQSKYFINTIYVDSDSPISPANREGGTIILGSIQGVPIFSIILGSIADPINPTIIVDNDGGNANSAMGTRFFNFWSVLQRGKNINSDRALGNSTTLDLRTTIFDSREEYVSSFTYRRYRPAYMGGGAEYDPVRLSTAIPAFYCKTKATANGTQSLLSTTNFNKSTTEYTYMEWPLPLISIQGNADNFTYHGRMMDIKLGHAMMPSGILAKEDPGLPDFDRVGFGGLWFPYSGTDILRF